MSQHTFLLDTNVFVQAHRTYYAFDICPGFWSCLLHHHNNACIYSVDSVQKEIKPGDKLGDWIKKAVPNSMFVPTDEAPVIKYYTEIMQWVQAATQFKPEAKAEFAQGADGWLVAYAKAHQGTVVTQEVFNAAVKITVPIPNVCKEFGVDCIDTFKMLRLLKASFNWKV